MNLLAVASWESLVALLVFLGLSALSTGLTKRRREQAAEDTSNAVEVPPTRGAHVQPARQLDRENALRRLLGGEPIPQAPPPPPILHSTLDEQLPSGPRDEEQFEPEQEWMNEPQEASDKPRQLRPPIVEPSLQHAALAPANTIRMEASEQREKGLRRVARLHEQAQHAAKVVGNGRGRRSREGARVVALVRSPQTVRQAFIASLVFGSPKALEN